MKLFVFCATGFLVGSAFAADPPPQQPVDPCKSGLPWLLPMVEPGFDVSEQFLLSGATTPVQVTVCHCTPKTPGKPTPHVWVNVTKKVEPDKKQGGSTTAAVSEVPSLTELDKKWRDSKGKTQFEFLGLMGNTVVVSRLSAPACMTTVGLSVLVMHSNKTEDRLGTSVAR